MLRTHSRQGRRFVLFSVCSTRRRRSPRYSPCARFPREQTVWGETYTSWADEISPDEVHILPDRFPVCLVMQRRAIQQFHEVGIDAIQPRGMLIRERIFPLLSRFSRDPRRIVRTLDIQDIVTPLAPAGSTFLFCSRRRSLLLFHHDLPLANSLLVQRSLAIDGKYQHYAGEATAPGTIEEFKNTMPFAIVAPYSLRRRREHEVSCDRDRDPSTDLPLDSASMTRNFVWNIRVPSSISPLAATTSRRSFIPRPT